MPRTISKPQLLIPIAAFLATLPLILKGGSCGHDMVFHVQGWYDAAAQLRHLHYPHWSFTSAWNAGEPRFIFYPPLSWLLGALLTLILPPQAAVSTFIFLSLTISGLTMYRLAAYFATPTAALIAATLYLANPYMLLNAFERSAFAELLASAWIPLLLLAVLRRLPTIPGIALPLALLWLTNAPAAVMSSYTLALLATLRLVTALIKTRVQPPLAYPEALASGLISQQGGRGFSPNGMQSPGGPLRLTLTYIAGTALGLALPAFYLIPAAYERRFIQVAMAVIPGMRVQDNFLFVRTNDPGHNGVNVQISLLAATLFALTITAVIALVVLSIRTRKRRLVDPSPAISVAVLAATLLLMLSPISIPIWNHLPELHYLQFPWRILSLVAAVLTFTVALILGFTAPVKSTPTQPSPSPRIGLHRAIPVVASLALAFVLGRVGFTLYAQFCQPNDHPQAIAALLRTHHGYPPTDEYTPNDADSDVLRTQNPAYWLIPAHANPNTAAPNTIPTPAELDPNLQNDDTPIPVTQTISATAPMHFSVRTTGPRDLVLNLRDYPSWDVTEADPSAMELHHPVHIPRDDGLIEIPLDHTDNYSIDIHWRTTPDQQLGLALTIIALLALLWLTFRPKLVTPVPND
jgi:hypothetical protein